MRGQAEFVDIVIVGSGPAGYTAAIYAARSGLDAWSSRAISGGALMAAGQMNNYPGFSRPVLQARPRPRDACTSTPFRCRVPLR